MAKKKIKRKVKNKKTTKKRTPKRVRVYSKHGKKKIVRGLARTSKRKSVVYSKSRSGFIERRYSGTYLRVRETTRTDKIPILEVDDVRFPYYLNKISQQTFKKHKIISYKKLYSVYLFIRAKGYVDGKNGKREFMINSHNALMSFKSDELKNKKTLQNKMNAAIDFVRQTYLAHADKSVIANLDFVSKDSENITRFKIMQAVVYLEYHHGDREKLPSSLEKKRKTKKKNSSVRYRNTKLGKRKSSGVL